jgi:hypothetical protein
VRRKPKNVAPPTPQLRPHPYQNTTAVCPNYNRIATPPPASTSSPLSSSVLQTALAVGGERRTRRRRRQTEKVNPVGTCKMRSTEGPPVARSCPTAGLAGRSTSGSAGCHISRRRSTSRHGGGRLARPPRHGEGGRCCPWWRVAGVGSGGDTGRRRGCERRRGREA